MNPTYDFTSKVALVTGASSGMGLATAQSAVTAGAGRAGQGMRRRTADTITIGPRTGGRHL
jgi:NAD(P)-dependent dehydrogenase (short-subunit alcohol dehydrogenase family)